MLNFEKGLENYNELLKSELFQKSNKNEAETRFKIIDQIFQKCLGWEIHDISVEENYQGKYTDYIFSTSNKALIVEAKKEGIYFDIPIENGRQKRSLKGLISENDEIRNAIIQVTDYCKERGIEFAVIFNGHQLIAFIGSRNDGIPPLEADAYVFESLEDIQHNFKLFWNILSKSAVEDRNLFKKLTNNIGNLSFSKLSQYIDNYPKIRIRNDIQVELDNLCSIIFEDINLTENEKVTFLKECYCTSGALTQYSILSKQILENKYTNMFEDCKDIPNIKPVTTKKGVTMDLIDNLYKRPILLIGDVGVGKTSFIENLIHIEAPKIFQEAFTLYLDFGTSGALTCDLKSFISKEILKQFRDKYKIDFEERNFVRGVYDSDIKRFANGINADLKETNPQLYREKEINMLENKLNNIFEHIKYSLLHIQKSWKKQLIIFLDNTDQRDELIQQEVFIIANEISQSWNSIVFLPMRPETYNRSNQLGHLSGYNTKAFTIAPPRTEQVIEKRINYALKIASGEELSKKLGGYIQLSKLSNFLKIFLYSFTVTNDLKDFIVNISGGNIRLALEYVRNFFGSGHIDTKKILDIYENTGEYFIPLHEFVKTVMYKNNEYYNSEEFPITNLFNITSHDSREYFLIILIIYYLKTINKNKTEGGYLNSKFLVEELQNEGFTPKAIENSIKYALSRKLIESSNKRIPEFMSEMPIQLRETSIGVYHIINLVQNFTYMEGILYDTAILDEIEFEKLKNYSFNNSDIIERLKRTTLFIEYLNNVWNNANFKTSYPWLTYTEKLKVNMIRIRNKLMRIQEKIIE